MRMNDREWLFKRQFAGISLGLERISLLLSHLGDPHLDFPSIHVAGTNGKGSLCALLSSSASRSGLKVGLFTTPHLMIIEERIRINGEPISNSDFDLHLSRIRKISADIFNTINDEPTFYEITFAIAMLAFSNSEVDRAIIETGLGGEGDATRVVDADLCVITRIGFDHTEILGPTLTEIASAKAGIHRPGIPIISLMPDNHEVLEVFKGIGEDIWFHEPSPDLSPWEIAFEFASRIAKVMNWKPPSENCNWPGRSPNWPPKSWFKVPVYASAAHNAQGFEAEIRSITNPSILVIGLTQKDNLKQSLHPLTISLVNKEMFPFVILTKPTKGRNKPIEPHQIEQIIFSKRDDKALIIDDFSIAFQQAIEKATSLGLDVRLLGSVYLIGDLLMHIQKSENVDLWGELMIHQDSLP